MVAVKLNLDVLGRGGEILIAIPQAALGAMRKAFARTASKDAAQPDPRWSQQIEREITRASVTLSAVLDERPMRLGEITKFRVGQVMELKATPRTPRPRRVQRRAHGLCAISASPMASTRCASTTSSTASRSS